MAQQQNPMPGVSNPTSSTGGAPNNSSLSYMTNLNLSNRVAPMSNIHVNTTTANTAGPNTLPGNPNSVPVSATGATTTLNSINFTSALLNQQQQQQQQQPQPQQNFYGTVSSLGIGLPSGSTATMSINPNTAAIITTPNGQIEYSQKQIQEVQNLIERLLTLYISKDEIIKRLETNSIEKNIILLVWNKLEQQNPDFFKAYSIRLRIKEQIELFNALVSHQAGVLQQQQQVQYDNQLSSTNPMFMQNGDMHQRRMSQSSQQLQHLDPQSFQQQQLQARQQFATPNPTPNMMNTSSSNPSFVTYNNSENTTTPINNPSTPSIYSNPQPQQTNVGAAQVLLQQNSSQNISAQQINQMMQSDPQFLSMLQAQQQQQQQQQQQPVSFPMYGSSGTSTPGVMNGGTLQQTAAPAEKTKKRKPSSAGKKKEANSTASTNRKKRSKKADEATASTPTSAATTPSAQDVFSPQMQENASNIGGVAMKKDGVPQQHNAVIQANNSQQYGASNPQPSQPPPQQPQQSYTYNNNFSQYLSSPPLYNSQTTSQQNTNLSTPTGQNGITLNSYYSNSNNPMNVMNTSMDQNAFSNTDLLSEYEADISDELFGSEFVEQNLMNFPERDQLNQSDIDKALG